MRLNVFLFVSAWYLFVCVAEISHPPPWIGDEQVHWQHAIAIVDGARPNPFAPGVYGQHGEINSYYRAGVMSLFGADEFGWRMGGVLSVWLAAVGVLWIGRMLHGPLAGTLAGSVFLLSHYLTVFATIGYYNVDLLAPLTWAAVTSLLAMRSSGPAGSSPFFALAILCAGLAYLFYPVLANTDRLIGGYPVEASGPPLWRMQWSIVNNAAAWFVDRSPTHYIRGTLITPLGGALAVVGCVERNRLPLLWLAAAFVASAALSPHTSIATTRMFLMMPPIALLAGVGGATVIGWAPVRFRGGSAIALLIAVGYWNLTRLV